mmetsp:Transcript_41901/g.132112  ORF Transcript_41901/g.132112 Transcript_41901/m.132112 type:complete len:205 (-) Transcript_41901:184-798(-)
MVRDPGDIQRDCTQCKSIKDKQDFLLSILENVAHILGFAKENLVVQQPCTCSPCHGGEHVNPDMPEHTERESRTQCPCWVHAPSGEGTFGEGSNDDGEPDGDRRCVLSDSCLVDCSCKNRKDEGEGAQEFKEEDLERMGEGQRPRGDERSLVHGRRQSQLESKSSKDCAKNLSCNVDEISPPPQPSSHYKGCRDGWIQMSPARA